MRILIAEQSLPLAHIGRQEMELKGYELELCHDADEAVRLVKNRDYDLSVLDMEIPPAELVSIVKRKRSWQSCRRYCSWRRCQPISLTCR